MNEQSKTDPRTGLDKIFASLRGIPVRRRTDDKWIAGVCSGLADRLGIDPVIVRAGLILLSLLWGVGVTIYLVAWALLPNDKDQIAAERALRDGDGGSVVLIIVAVLALFGGGWWGGGSDWGFPWGLVITGLIIWWVVQQSRNRPDADERVRAQQSGPPFAAGPHPASGVPPTAYGTSSTGSGPAPTAFGAAPTAYGSTPPAYGPTPTGYGPTPPGHGAAPTAFAPPPAAAPPVAPRKPRRRSGGPLMALMAIGLALVTYGTLNWLGTEYNWVGNHVAIALAGSLAVIGLLLVALGIAGWRSGFVAFLAVVLAISAFSSAAVPSGIHLNGRVGDERWVPTSVQPGANYRIAAGDGVLDLSDLPTEGMVGERIAASVGLGELTVIVPDDLTVQVVGHVGLGEISLPDGTNGGDDGTDVSRTIQVGDGPVEVLVDAGVGVGQLNVVKE